MPAVPLSQVAVHLRPEDNVAVAARPIPPGAELRHDGPPSPPPAASA
jgi:altronate hydrolase